MSLGFRCFLLVAVLFGGICVYRLREREVALWLGLSPPPEIPRAGVRVSYSPVPEALDLESRVTVTLEGVAPRRRAPRSQPEAAVRSSWNVPRLFAGDAESPGRAPQEPPPDLILADEPVGEDEPPAPAEGEPYPGDADASGDAEAPDGGGGAAEAPFTIHEVEQGDNLWKLAERYLGAGHRLEKIRELNRDVLRHGDTIRAGMEIKIPVRNADK